jgi:diguanylate cyclase (GGDEF)-like protein
LSRLGKHLFRQALEVLPVPALIVDAGSRDSVAVFANRAAARAFGMAVTELVGRPLRSLMNGESAEGSSGAWCLRTPGGPLTFNASPLHSETGSPGFCLLTLAGESPVRAEPVSRPAAAPAVGRPRSGGTAATRPTDPNATGAFATGAFATGSFSVTETWSRMRDERNDPATGVLGREAFMEILERDLAEDRPADRNVNVMLFRVEGVESYQSLFGRHATDACLRKVAHTISTNLRRGSDACGRTGSDEFMVLCHGGDSASTAEFAARIAQRVRDLAIHHPRAANGRYVTVSWGLVVSGGNSRTSRHEVLEAAGQDLERRAALLSPSTASAG